MASLPLTVAPLAYEEHYWVAEQDGMTPRARLASASGAYRSALVPRISDLQPSIPFDLAAEVAEAAAALASFDTYARASLGPASPSLGPMASILLRTESASSSQIENLTAGARQLALAELGQATSGNANAVVANVHAMEAALDVSGRLDGQKILDMHRALLGRQPGWQEHAGRYRDQLVWVGASSISPVGASHVAPQAEHVGRAMDDLVEFMARDDLPAVLQVAIAHAQLETIHPFVDGNGRTGRAVVHALLKLKGVLRTTTAPISAGLLRQTESYVDALGAFRAGDARPIVERFSEASLFAATTGRALVDALASQVVGSEALLDGARVRSDAAARRVLPHLVSNPVVDAAFLKRTLGLSDPAVHRALDTLASAGVLTERTGRRRDRVWQHEGILAELDAYAVAIHRR